MTRLSLISNFCATESLRNLKEISAKKEKVTYNEGVIFFFSLRNEFFINVLLREDFKEKVAMNGGMKEKIL